MGDRVVQIYSVEYSKDGHPCYFTTEGRWFGNGTKARLLLNVENTILPEGKAIKPKSWSEGDEVNLVRALAFIRNTSLKDVDEIKESVLTWIASLKDRYTWKPSDKQIEALKTACDEHWELDGLEPLYTLYQDLKKLKG